MKEQLRAVAKAITKTEGEIDRVTAQISELVDEIMAARGRRDEEIVRRLEKKEEQLRDEKNLLLKKEQQLRDEKNLLLKERKEGEKQSVQKSPREGN